MSDLSEQGLEDWIKDFEEAAWQDLTLSLKPTKLIVPRSMFRKAMRLLFYRPPIRKVKGMRARKRALYWREK